MSQQKDILGNIYTTYITKTWCTIYHHHQDFMHNWYNWIISCHYLCLNKRTFLVTYIQHTSLKLDVQYIIIIRILWTIAIPLLANPVTPLLQWDIWQSLYGHCLMPALKHSIHPEIRKRTWNNFMSLLVSPQNDILGNIYTTTSLKLDVQYIIIIIRILCTISIPASVNPVTPLLQWDIWQSLYGHSVMPTLKHSIHPEMRKRTWNNLMSLPTSQQKNVLCNV